MEIPPNAVTDLFPLAGKDQYDQINKKTCYGSADVQLMEVD
jgi:hypothetical protein